MPDDRFNPDAPADLDRDDDDNGADDPQETLLSLLHQWAIGHIQQPELAERLGRLKSGDKTLDEKFTAQRQKEAKERGNK